MHTCLVFHSRFPNSFSTGIQETVRNLTDYVEVTVVAAGDERETVTWNGATVHRLVSDSSTAKSLYPTKFGIKANLLINKINKNKGVDLIHMHAFPALGAVLTMVSDIPILVDIRGTAVSNKVFELMSRLGLRLQQHLVDQVITVSDPVARHIFGQNHDVSIVPLGADLDRFNPEEVTPAEGSSGTTAVYVGHLHPSRNLETLIEAVSLAVETVPSLECLIVGDGDGRSALERVASEHGVSDVVNFVGSVPHDEVPRLLAAADIGLAYVTNKPQYRHQPPIKTVEYLASGLPVVATDTEGNKQFVDEHTGVLREDTATAYADGITKLARDHTDYSTDELRDAVSRYDYKYTVEHDLLPIYERIVSEGDGGP